MTKTGDSDDARVRWLFEHLYSREITATEKNDIQKFLTSYQQTSDTQPISSESANPAYQSLCRVMLTSNEFFYID